MSGRFQPGEEAIFARLPSSPWVRDLYLFFPNDPIRPRLGSRVIVLGPQDSQPEPLLVVETSSGLRFYASEDLLDRVDDRGALIREYWRSHRDDGLRALRANEPFFGMILTGPVGVVVADFTDISPPTAGPMVERVQFRLDARMRTRLGFWVMCEGEEVERLSELDIRPLDYFRDRPVEFLAALQSLVDQGVHNALSFDIHPTTWSGSERTTTSVSENIHINASPAAWPIAGFIELRRQMMDLIAGAVAIPARYLFGAGDQPPRWPASVESVGEVLGVQRCGGVGDARAKSVALLKDWLTPEQLGHYERDGWFEVAGGETGNRYRVHQPGPYNVDVLRPDGAVDHQICVEPFHPVERGMCFPVAPGDFLLTQKIALEKDELATLRIANRRQGPSDYL